MKEATNKEMKLEVAKVVEQVDKRMNRMDARLDEITTLILQQGKNSEWTWGELQHVQFKPIKKTNKQTKTKQKE